MSRLRLGIALFVISWLPIAQVVLVVAHEHQKLTSSHASNVFRLGEGLRQTPQRLWQLFWHGQEA
jgi:type IV secretory pathway VirB3-like protein